MKIFIILITLLVHCKEDEKKNNITKIEEDTSLIEIEDNNIMLNKIFIPPNSENLEEYNSDWLHYNRELSKLLNVSASSTLEKYSTKYGSKNLITENPNSWCEGNSSDGINEFINFQFSNDLVVKEKIIRKIYVYNGFGNLEFFKQNNRVSKLLIETDTGNNEMISLEDATNLQIISLKNPLTFKNKIKFTIKEIFKGTKYSDTCIHKLMIDESLLYYHSYRFEIKGTEARWIEGYFKGSECLTKELENFPSNFKEGCLLNCNPSGGPDYSIILKKDFSVETNYFGCSENCNTQWQFNGKWKKDAQEILIEGKISEIPYTGCYHTMSEEGEKCNGKYYEWFNSKFGDIADYNMLMKIKLDDNKKSIIFQNITGRDKNSKIKLKITRNDLNFGCLRKNPISEN